MLQLLRFLVSSALNYCLIMSLRQANLRLQGRQPLPRHRRRCALAVARLRPGRTTVQQQYRQETLSSNRDALEYLASLGVDRGELHRRSRRTCVSLLLLTRDSRLATPFSSSGLHDSLFEGKSLHVAACSRLPSQPQLLAC